jgi:hypothetical protein
MAMVWDEGDYIWRAEQVSAWFRLLADIGNPAGGLRMISERAITEYWPFINWQEGHPAWFAVPIALSRAMFGDVLSPLTAARLGPITVFSVAAGVAAARLRRDVGVVAAVAGPVALLTLPSVFAHAHFATLDGQLTAWWLLLWSLDADERRTVTRRAIVGVVLGLTFATKFTGWLAIVPLALSQWFVRGRDPWRELSIVVPAALLTFVAVNPPMWHSPLAALMEHVRLNLGRGDVWNLPVVFFGTPYDMQRSLPWYNTLAWLVLVTPPPLLVLGAIGAAECARPGAAAPRVLCLHWATLMIMRALPGAPPHDGVRLFLPAFGLWCIFAAMGAQRVFDTARTTLATPIWRRAVIAALASIPAALTIDLVRYFPQALSYYSPAVGGLRGAVRAGMEPTYWWDALDDGVLDWINAHTEPGATVAFSKISGYNLWRLREWGRLRPEAIDPATGPFTWYVLQNQTSMLTPVDRILIEFERPIHVNYAGRHRPPIPLDLDVPLILVFSGDQYRRAAARAGAAAAMGSPE